MSYQVTYYRYRACFLFGFIFLFVLLGASTAIVSAQDGLEVHGLSFSGNTTVSDGQLESLMSMKAIGSFRRNILGKDAILFSNETLQYDIRRLRRFYQQEGFLDVCIDPADLSVADDNRSVQISLSITENEPYLVNSIHMFSAGGIGEKAQPIESDTAVFFKEFQTRPEERFRDSLIYHDQGAIIGILENLGHPYAGVTPILSVDSQTNRVNIEWAIDPGPLCRIGNIVVSGLRHANEDVVLDQMTISTGDVFSWHKLEECQRRVYGLSLFHVVTVKAQLSDDKAVQIPIEIRIDEAPRFSSRLGVGYGREEKVRVYSDSHILGFLGGTRSLNLFMKHSEIEPYHINLKLRQPAFLTSYTTAEVSPFILRQKEPAYDQIRYGGHVTLLHRIMKQLNGSVSFLLERVDLDTSSLGILAIDTTRQAEIYNKSSILLGLSYDNSTPMFNPERGVYAAASLTVSGIGFGSDYHYNRLLVDVRSYKKVFGIIIAGKIKAGGILSKDVPEFIPVEDRFYAGGSASVRGWSRAALGPQLEGTPIGGNTLFESSFELRYPIYDRLSGVLFYDFGNVWRDSYTVKLDKLRYSVGAGIRVRTPIGPIRLDIAQPVDDIKSDVQYHISVGEAF